MKLFIFGLGYTACFLVDALQTRCSWIGGTTRGEDASWRAKGVDVFPYEAQTGAADPALRAALGTATHILVTIPPSCEQKLFTLLSEARASPVWIGYLSSLSVYGDHKGRWVDESTPPRPGLARGQARLAAEILWQKRAQETGIPLTVFRLAGIYGPGRNALVSLQNGKAERIIKAGTVFNRIHVADAAQIIKEALETTCPGIYNVTDNFPAPPQEVMTYAAHLCKCQPPPERLFHETLLSPMRRSFYQESKRASNALIKKTLSFSFQYPSYKEGLRALMNGKL